MPIALPRLDDHDFESLTRELLERIPAHTPEWTNPRPGDPGRTLLELFAWLGDSLLYRANLIPERQRLAFLRLLGQPLVPAQAARGLVSVDFGDELVEAVDLAPLARIDGPQPFETLGSLQVLPVKGEVWAKRRLSANELRRLTPLLDGLRDVYRLDRQAVGYRAEPIFESGARPAGFDVIGEAIDRSLWIGLFAKNPEQVVAARELLADGQRILSLGFAPAIGLPATLEALPERARVPHIFEVTTETAGRYVPVEAVGDTTGGLMRRGVVRLSLPGGLGAPPADVEGALDAGVGDQPPRLDDAEKAATLVAWIRIRPTERLESWRVSWLGTHAVEVDQRRTTGGVVIGQGSGRADLVLPLPGSPVEPDSLTLQVEEADRGFVLWRRVDDVLTAGRDDAVYSLDSEAGTVRFGDGVRGRIPGLGRRVRVERMRHGGGAAGNLPPGSLKSIQAKDQAGAAVVRPLEVSQALATEGGEDGERLEEAERRIPAMMRHRERAVTAGDYRRLAFDAPGQRLGRVEVLPGFKPHQRREDVPGVVSVMVWPAKSSFEAPAPRPDRPLVERLHAHLDPRRPVATELYVIGCEYVPIGLAVAVQLRDGVEPDPVLFAVRQAMRQTLFALPPGGATAAGWALGRDVVDRELEVAAARVPGVSAVPGVRIFTQEPSGDYEPVRLQRAGEARLEILPWQLPELMAVVAVVSDRAPTSLEPPNPYDPEDGIAVPVVPETC